MTRNAPGLLLMEDKLLIPFEGCSVKPSIVELDDVMIIGKDFRLLRNLPRKSGLSFPPSGDLTLSDPIFIGYINDCACSLETALVFMTVVSIHATHIWANTRIERCVPGVGWFHHIHTEYVYLLIS